MWIGTALSLSNIVSKSDLYVLVMGVVIVSIGLKSLRNFKIKCVKFFQLNRLEGT